MPVYVPAFAGNHCAYPWRDGQAELTQTTFYKENIPYTYSKNKYWLDSNKV